MCKDEWDLERIISDMVGLGACQAGNKALEVFFSLGTVRTVKINSPQHDPISYPGGEL